MRRAFFFLLLAAGHCHAHEVILHAGLDGPINSLSAARDAARKARAENPGAPVRVLFAAGTYPMESPVTFDSADSGLPLAPVTFEPEPGAIVIFSSGRRITGWRADANGVWSTRIPEVSEGKWYFEQLWINGRRATRARTPNTGFMNLYSKAGADVFPEVKEPAFQTFVMRPADFDLVKSIPPNELPDALVTVTHAWTVGQCRIEALNEEARAVKIKGRSRYPFVENEQDQRCFVENYRAALDAAGEWFLTRDGTLFYKPLPGEDLNQVEVFAPVAEQFMLFTGDAKAGNWVEHLRFRGLHFQHGQQQYGATGHHDGQAASGIGAVIELDRARHISFHDCEVARTGKYAFWFRQDCADCDVTHCHLHDLGAGGVRIGDTRAPVGGAEPTHGITVDDCIIQHGGRMYPSACGIFLAHAADCSLLHNDIGDFYYTGISAGWVWGYRPSPSKRNRIDYNHIHHLGWGYLSDMGGVYLLGRSEGTTVSRNYVHDVASYRYGGWGLYTDEGSTGVTMEFNLVHDTSEATFHQHYGKWNQISNNIFAYGKKAQIQRSRPETHTSFAYERNIVIYDQPTLLDGTWYNWEPGTLEMRDNVYWNSAGLPVKFHELDLAGWQKKTGRDEGSVVADPLFFDAARRDFRLKKESPAFKLGFKAFDASEAGVRGGGAWRKLAAAAQYPDFHEKSQPWPKPEYAVNTDFEHMGLSFPEIPRQEINWENKGDSIFVSDEQAHSGRRSLKFTDAPGLERSWNPHLVLKPDYKDGTVRVSFALRMEPGAVMNHEWRSEGHPYFVGPSFTLAGGVLQVRSGPRLELPLSQWINFEIETKLGSAKWRMRVDTGAGAPSTLENLPCQAEWKELAWIGWVSAANDKTAFYLDDLKMECSH